MRHERCRWVTDKKIGRWHLPGCMGAAVYGPNGCTCQARAPLEDDSPSLEDRVEALEARLAKPERQ